MGELTFEPYDCHPPEVPLATLYDDLFNTTPGWSFVLDPRNQSWVEPGRRWILEQISRSPKLLPLWFNSEPHEELKIQHIQHDKAQVYLDRVESFRKHLLVAVHLLAGQPARATELLVIRYINTQNGGLRNIYFDHGMTCIITTYHKSANVTGQSKLIYRFLPRDLSVLVVRYLWMVLPFAQWLSKLVTGLDDLVPMPWLWANKLVQPELLPVTDIDGQPTPSHNLHYSTQVWSSDKMRRLLQTQTAQHLKCKINIHSWRHIAVAISRKYIDQDQFLLEGLSYENSDTEDNDSDRGAAKDSFLDLQAAHSSHTAATTYKRLIINFGHISDHQAFKAISVR